MPKFQIVEVTEYRRVGLAFYEGSTADEALATYLRDRLHAMTLLDLIEPGSREPGEDIVLKGPPDAVLHKENGRPAELRFEGEKFTAVPCT